MMSTVGGWLEQVRDAESPLTDEMLRPLDPACEYVQFSRALSDADYGTLADWLHHYPTVTLRAYESTDGSITNLDFLRFFPALHAFQADCLYHSLVSLDGLNYLRPDLSGLGLGQTRKRLSLAPLARFTNLKRLYLEAQTKDFEVVGQLRTLTSLTLRSTTMPDLSTLLPLTGLRAPGPQSSAGRETSPCCRSSEPCSTSNSGWYVAWTT